jgi:effector-binding domain-containing protein
MGYEIVTEVVSARPIAAVRRRVAVGDVPSAWKPALDQVWAFLRRQDGAWHDGHNVFVYHHATPGEPMDVDFGVEVTGVFDGEGEVRHTETPSGRVVSTHHIGPYDELGQAHDAINAWSLANGRALGDASWEIYGDWNEDPTRLEVQVVYLLG